MNTPQTTHRIAFVYIHAMATFYHHIWHNTYVDPSIHSVTAVLSLMAAVVALWFPFDWRAVAGLLVMNLVDVFFVLPAVPNHWLLTAFFDAFLLIALVVTRGAPDVLSRIREPVAWGVAILYFYTGFWKLTTDFLNHDVSCGVLAWRRLADQVPGIPADGFGPLLATYGTLVLELVFPFLLVWKRSRGVTVFLFAGFHLLLGLDIIQNFANFSTVMWALLLVMLDDDAFERLGTTGPALLRVSRAWAVAMVLLQPFAAVPSMHVIYLAMRWFLWVVHGPLVLWVFFRLAGGKLPDRSTLPWGWAFTVVVLLNGMMPILGLKTRNSWQMYANLRLEADASNHLLLPRSLDLAGLLADDVTILDVSDPELKARWVRPEHRETWYMFRTELSKHPELSVRYERDGQQIRVDRVGDDPELSRPYPVPIRWFVWFRPLGPEVGRVCMW